MAGNAQAALGSWRRSAPCLNLNRSGSIDYFFLLFVIRAHAGIQYGLSNADWIPACARMTRGWPGLVFLAALDPHTREDDERGRSDEAKDFSILSKATPGSAAHWI